MMYCFNFINNICCFFIAFSSSYKTAYLVTSEKLKNAEITYNISRSYSQDLLQQNTNRIQTFKDFYNTNPDLKLIGGPTDPTTLLDSETKTLVDPFLKVDPDFQPAIPDLPIHPKKNYETKNSEKKK
jgi:hypothetical protein